MLYFSAIDIEPCVTFLISPITLRITNEHLKFLVHEEHGKPINLYRQTLFTVSLPIQFYFENKTIQFPNTDSYGHFPFTWFSITITMHRHP